MNRSHVTPPHSINPRYYAWVLAEYGAEFRGVRPGPQGALILFADQQLGHTLAVPESDFSPAAVSHCLQECRSAFDLERRIQTSLC